MKLKAYERHTTPGGDMNYDALDEFENLLKNEWDAVEFCSFDSIDAIEVTLCNAKIADMPLRAIATRLQAAIDAAHKRADGWDWLHFDVEEVKT